MKEAHKVCVIGAGPAAFGTLARLVQLKKDGLSLDISVFSSGNADQEEQITAAYRERYEPRDINAILKKGKVLGSSGILPPRSFFNQALQSHEGKDGLKTEVKVSITFGGLGNYWSSSVFPTHSFSDPLSEKLGDLGAHYKFIADQISISGLKGDPLNHFFDDVSINNPPISSGKGLCKLKGRWDKVNGQNLDLAIGLNRFALNTHGDEKNGCVQCGDCMYGCPRDAMFRAAKPIEDFARQGMCEIVYEPVTMLKKEDQKVRLTTKENSYVFDKAFICTGALGSIELLGRSYGTPDKTVELYDNLLWYFPAFSVLPQAMRKRDKNFAFAELAGGIFDHTDEIYNHLLVSTLPDAVFDNMLGRNKVSQALSTWLTRHILIGAMYGSNKEFVRYRMGSVKGEWKALSLDKSVEAIDGAKFDLFKDHLARNGWRTSKRLVRENATSGHYTANLGIAYGIKNLARNGVFDDNVFVCDTSSWDGPSMSQQHTFTIMANAARIVQNTFS